MSMSMSRLGPKPANSLAPCLPRRYGVPRELGAVLIRGTQLRVIIPRVHADRTVAQFRVQATVGVGPPCRVVVVGVGVGVLVLARLRTRPTHAWRRRTGAGGLVVAALLEQHRPQAHDGARGGAPRREQQGQARAHQVPAIAASPWPTAPTNKHPPNTPVACAATVSTRRRSCCASLFLRTTISVWNTPRRSLPSKRSAWRSRCAPSLPVKPPKPLSHPRTLHHPHTTQTLAPPTNMALVHIRQGAQRDGGPEVVSTACFPRHALRSKSAHSKTFAEDGYTVERM
jgi:hypothetical protein